MGSAEREQERRVDEAVSELTGRPEGWILVAEEFALGGPCYDRAIVAALRKLDPMVAPLWVTKAYRRPGGGIEICPRHLIARYVPDPIVQVKMSDFNRRGIWGVSMPSPVPAELQGLPAGGPYLEALLLEGPSPDQGLTPGPFLPMTWDVVKHLAVATHALRNHRIEELDAKRIAASIAAEDRKEREVREDFRAKVCFEREARLEARGELIRVGSATGQPVSVSASLLRLRKIAREGASL